MKVFRYRRPSLKILLRITTAKRRVRKELGVADARSHSGGIRT